MSRHHFLEYLFAWMGGDKGDVVGGMMVSRGDFKSEWQMEKIVDFWDDVTTLLDCKRASLHVSKRIKDGCTGGQKSFCISITTNAEVEGLKGDMVRGGVDNGAGDDDGGSDSQLNLEVSRLFM